MSSDRVFQITLFISLIAHGVVLFHNPNINIFPKQKQERDPELSYLKTLPETKPISETKSLRKEPFLKLDSRVSFDKRLPPPFIDKESIFKENKSRALRNENFIKPASIKPDVIAIKKKITLPPIDTKKINNPSYISYYQIVREKIKRAAYQNYTGSETGEVTISFVISDDGFLKDLKLLEEKSSKSAYLKEIAMKSVKDASGFPAFPKELDYPRLSFNLTITFEVE